MAHGKQTLLSYLKHPNPHINSEHSYIGSNTKTSGAMWCAYEELKVWEDFTFETLKRLYKDLLYQPFSEDELPNFNQKLPYHITEIRNENTLNSLLVRWNNAVVSAALAASQSKLSGNSRSGSRKEGEIFMACGCQATLDHPKGRKIPDWAGIMKDKVYDNFVDGQKRVTHKNLLPGDTKLSTKWNSEKMEKAKNDPAMKAPINQILTYCVTAEVRYGYLITQEEVVVFRISERDLSEPDLESKGQRRRLEKNALGMPQEKMFGRGKSWYMEYKAIPWELDEGVRSNNLTVNLALWWLHMLAVQERSLEATYSKLGGQISSSEAGDSGSCSLKDNDSQEDDYIHSFSRASQSSFHTKRGREESESSLEKVQSQEVVGQSTGCARKRQKATQRNRSRNLH